MSDNQLGVLLEDIQDKLQRLAETVSVMRQDISEMKPQLAKIDQNTSDLGAMKAAVRDHAHLLQNHEQRLQVLEMPKRA